MQRSIKQRIRHIEEQSDITSRSVLDRLNVVADRCMQINPVIGPGGIPTGEYVFDSSGSNRALELLGKHLRLFVDVSETRITVDRARTFVRPIVDIVARYVMEDDQRAALIEELHEFFEGAADGTDRRVMGRGT